MFFMEKQTSEKRRRGIVGLMLFALLWLLLLPAAIGVGVGYGVHRYQASLIREDFTPYRLPTIVPASAQPMARAYIYIKEEMTIEFGEIENFKRYREEWDLVNSGTKPLEIEIVSQTCDVEMDGKPIQPKEILPGRSMATLALSWVVKTSGPEFQHEAVLKTNDDDTTRRNLQFRVHGTVNPAIEFFPPNLEFGTLASGQTKELTTQVVCYRTKSFSIDGFSFANETLRSAFDVKLEPIADLSSLSGTRPAASGYSVVVTAKADSLEPREYTESLLLRSNLPETEGLELGLKVTRQ